MLLSTYRRQRHFFNEQALNWHFPDSDRQKITKILESVNLPPDGVILDAGCGTGNLFSVIQEIVPTVTIIACDMAPQMLNESRRRNPGLQIPLWVGFCEELPLKNESVDLALNYCIFPHIKDKDKALSELRRVLKPGGRYLIIHPNGRSATNYRHRQIGMPIANDLLPPTAEIKNRLQNHEFSVRQLIDRDDLFLIEAGKSN